MSPASATVPTIIRNAKDDEYGSLGRFHAAVFANDPMIRLISSNVDPEEKIQRIWIGGAKANVEKGHGTVLVTERTDNKETLGLCWYEKVNQNNPPKYPTSFPKGLNVAEYEKKEMPIHACLLSLLDKYDKGFIVLNQLAVDSKYQSQGFGKAMLLRMIAHAKEQGLNVVLSSTSASVEFYKKHGFEEVAPSVLLAGGIRSDNVMSLELFKPSQGPL